jgi:hypothetical protein
MAICARIAWLAKCDMSPWLVGVARAIHEIGIDELIGSKLRYCYGRSQTDICFRSTLIDGS